MLQLICLLAHIHRLSSTALVLSIKQGRRRWNSVRPNISSMRPVKSRFIVSQYSLSITSLLIGCWSSINCATAGRKYYGRTPMESSFKRTYSKISICDIWFIYHQIITLLTGCGAAKQLSIFLWMLSTTSSHCKIWLENYRLQPFSHIAISRSPFLPILEATRWQKWNHCSYHSVTLLWTLPCSHPPTISARLKVCREIKPSPWQFLRFAVLVELDNAKKLVQQHKKTFRPPVIALQVLVSFSCIFHWAFLGADNESSLAALKSSSWRYLVCVYSIFYCNLTNK